jgi:hypothetical protein
MPLFISSARAFKLVPRAESDRSLRAPRVSLRSLPSAPERPQCSFKQRTLQQLAPGRDRDVKGAAPTLDYLLRETAVE